MDRRVITPGNPFEFDTYVEPGVRAGWFDADKADRWDEATCWDGNNNRGRASGSQFGFEQLWRTHSGRYILRRDLTNEFNGGDHYYEIDLDAAQEWAVRAGLTEDELAEAFPDGIADEDEPRPVGRPAEGAARTVKMDDTLWTAIGQRAAAEGTDRSALIRRIVRDYLDHTS